MRRLAVALMALTLVACDTAGEGGLGWLFGDMVGDDAVALDTIQSTTDTTTTHDMPSTSGESALAATINEYRVSLGLAAIPYSPSLTAVAEAHAHDLEHNDPATGDCNLHSWSDQGSWTACCYTPDHAEAQGMWDKPRELTSYPGDGFEISYSASWGPSPDDALAGWQGSQPHHEVILNEGMWASMTWHAMGAAIYGGYAVVWFGTEPDPAR